LRALIRTAVLGLIFATPAVAREPAYIVVDMSSGAVLAEHDAAQPWYPASVTKLMTSYVTFQALKAGIVTLDTPVLVTQHALNEPPSKMGYPVGTKMTLDNAMKMMIVKSANDIAMAIAETVGGSESGFVAQMNVEARRLGMNSSHFRNPNGLPDDGQMTTARDLAVLTSAIWSEFPERRHYFGITAIKTGKRVLRSYNALLDHYRGSTGMKTGFICNSGFNLVATASRSGTSLIAVVLGAESAKERSEIAAGLLDKAFGGGSTPGKGPKLASFGTLPSAAAPINMKPQVCGKRNKNEGEEDAVFAGMGLKSGGSSLEEKRFYVMEPVAVSTLFVPPQPDPPPKKKKTKPASGKKKANPAPERTAAGDDPSDENLSAAAKAAKKILQQ
jgi:D-alanyl-D-alanine carboxypeptidase